MGNSADLIEILRRAVPTGRARLTETETSILRDLTTALIETRTEAIAEYERFTHIETRKLCLPEEELSRHIAGSTVLVTGGTGCVGSVLMEQLAALRPARLASLGRGVTAGANVRPLRSDAEYLRGDVRDRVAVEKLVTSIRPDIIFHLAAQRSPALAETEVHRTVSTNVMGVRNILEAAAEAGTRQVVVASTGKALRPYSPEVYTASKRAAEWIATTAADKVTCSAARFTHVIDNSIIHQRLRSWAAAGHDPHGGDVAIRLHSADIAFYVQSALESAQLLLLAMLGAAPGEFRVHAIKDLGWPVNLIDVALGVLRGTGSTTPLYISGYDPGYEEVAFPGLYDPATAGDVSPLLNAFEAAAMTVSPCPMTDSFRLDMAPEPAAPKLLQALEGRCAQSEEPEVIRRALDELSWSVLDATLDAAAPTALARCAAHMRRHEHQMSPAHRRITQAIAARADP